MALARASLIAGWRGGETAFLDKPAGETFSTE
jgi:hypothetical protein